MSITRSPLANSYEGLHARAQNLWMAGDLAGAANVYRRLAERLHSLSDRILDHRPGLRDLHRSVRLELTRLLRQQGRYAEAIEVEQVLLESHPEEARLWRRDLARLRVAKGQVEEGLAELRAIAAEEPEDFENWYTLGLETRIEGHFAESEEAFDRALTACPGGHSEDLAQIHYQRFLLFQETGHIDAALAAWQAALVADPETGKTIREVCGMLTGVGRYSQALEYADRDGNDLQRGFQQGLIASLTGKAHEAKQQWQQVAELDPNQYEYGQDAWAEAVLRLGNQDRALEWLQDGLSRYPTPRLFVLSGIGWAMRDDADLAARLFQQAINAVRHQRPPKQKLDSADWRLLDSLVSDEETKKALKTYFAVVETLWV